MERPSEDLVERVRRYYADQARGASEGATEACCDPGCRPTLYSLEDASAVPQGALAASAGCANPVAVADLRPGEVVLDLGSGGGIDVLLSARRVGPSGKAYGLDMTDEMLELARENQRRAGLENVEFLKGRIEAVPLPDSSVDVILSNCVINLSPEKERVFREAHRVLRRGGRFAVADVVAESDADGDLASTDGWEACIAGALTRAEYEAGLTDAGFTDVSIETSHEVAPGHTSVVVRATKPRS